VRPQRAGARRGALARSEGSRLREKLAGPEREAQPAPRYLAVVRRGETEIYRMLKDYLGRRGLVDVVWDRRVGDRRGNPRPQAPAADRRSGDRRRDPPHEPTARTLGFFLIRPARPRR
jgi:hypothetical protein